jgi:hypothetical protein
MFGDELEEEICIELLDRLKKTKLPFQCGMISFRLMVNLAHGRPSMYPLTQLSSVTKKLSKISFK